jgi:hypothetical protein
MDNTRIVTRPDFDGIVCAVLLQEIFGSNTPILWTQPNAIQNGTTTTHANDVVANLPLKGPCKLWFDHHVSNATQYPYKGSFRIAPSAARVIADYFGDRLPARFDELIRQADKIDSAQLTLEEILRPEEYPCILLSMCIGSGNKQPERFCDRLVSLLGKVEITEVIKDPVVRSLGIQVVENNRAYNAALRAHTVMLKNVSITDFRGQQPAPDGNRFLVYSLFPDAMANVKIFEEPPHTVVKLGHSVLNRTCRVNVGCLLSRYGGGGHRGAGACRLAANDAERYVTEIIAALIRNEGSVGDQTACAT